MAEDIRIAIIGHGFMGHEHEKMLSDFPGIKLVGISDRDPGQLEDVKEGIRGMRIMKNCLQIRKWM